MRPMSSAMHSFCRHSCGHPEQASLLAATRVIGWHYKLASSLRRIGGKWTNLLVSFIRSRLTKEEWLRLTQCCLCRMAMTKGVFLVTKKRSMTEACSHWPFRPRCFFPGSSEWHLAGGIFALQLENSNRQNCLIHLPRYRLVHPECCKESRDWRSESHRPATLSVSTGAVY